MEPLLAAVQGRVQLDTLSPESRPSSPSVTDKPKLRVVERGSQACNECRRHKIRCHPAPDDPEHTQKCARCQRMQLECVFKKHNRGRKRKNPPPSDAQELPLAPAKQPHVGTPDSGVGGSDRAMGGRHPPPSGFWNRGSPDRALFGSAARYPFMALEQPRDEPEPGVGGSAPTHPARQPTSVSLRSMVTAEPWDEEDDGYTDTEELLDRPRDRDRHPDTEREPSQHFPPAPTGYHTGDPVALGYLTLEEAKILFNLFMKNFNIAMPIVDPATASHDSVRRSSPFLYTVILCIASRYMSVLGYEPMPLSANSAHQQIVILARDHLMWAFAEAASTLDVVQAIVALCLWKEPDDDKAAFYFNRAVVLARELDLGRMPPPSEVARMSDIEKRDLRARQRLWLSLFSTNSIFHMQFKQPMLISHTDPLVSTSTLWLRHAPPDSALMDTFAAFSVDLRKRFLHYRQLLTEGQPNALTLSVLTETMNSEWKVTSEAWISEIIEAGGNATYVHKPRVWYSSLGLNLNLIILNQTLRIPPSERIPPATPSHGRGSAAQLRSIPAFLCCLNAASTILQRFHDLDKAQLTYASDTLLHFALYAATFLWSLCRTPKLYDFQAAEVEFTRDLILKVAATLDDASAYPHSSPALHARYLRRLCRSGPQSEDLGSTAGSDMLGHVRGQSYSETERTPIDPALTGAPSMAHGLPLAPAQAFSEPLAAPGVGAGGTELDFLLTDFQWAGVELPWTAVDPSLMGPAPGAYGTPTQQAQNGRYGGPQIV